MPRMDCTWSLPAAPGLARQLAPGCPRQTQVGACAAAALQPAQLVVLHDAAERVPHCRCLTDAMYRSCQIVFAHMNMMFELV
jgi:hypothetical protein